LHARGVRRESGTMKIAVSGKGGVGKTFVAGSLAARFAGTGRPVIAIDADPAPTLAFALGLSYEEAEEIVPVAENEELIRLKTGTATPGVFRLTFSVDDIIRSAAVPTPSGASLLVMGTVRAAGAGCTCPAHAVLRALFRHLVVERDEVVVMDMEAGIEHLGRGTSSHVDLLLIVSDANLRSLEVALTIAALARGAGIPRIGLVGNRVTGKRQEEAIRTFAEKHGIELLAVIPYDEAVADAGMAGTVASMEGSAAVRAIAALSDRLMPPPAGRGTKGGGL